MTDTELAQRFDSLEAALNMDVLERSREVHAAVNALISRKHFFMIGEPGTAKSFLVRRMTNYIDGLDGDNYFQWLLTKYSVMEELFGPPDLALLRQGRYKRKTERKLPVAKIAFLDEIFKGNSSILNALLTIINERLFFNDDDPPEVPLSSIFAASNEMPADDNLNALWDRLQFRFKVERLREGGNFVRMLQTQHAFPDTIVSWDEVAHAQREAEAVRIPGDIVEALHVLRQNLHKEGIQPTDRRFKDALGIVQAEAWLDSRDVADMDDLSILRHIFWDKEDDQRTVEKVVLQLANPIDREASDIMERLEGLNEDLDHALREKDEDVEDDRIFSKACVEMHHKLQRARDKKYDIAKRIEESGRKSELIGELNKRLLDVATRLQKEGFGVDRAMDL